MLHHFLDIQLLIINKIKKHYRVRLTSKIQGYSEYLCLYSVHNCWHTEQCQWIINDMLLAYYLRNNC
jgi:hypothetical protein